MFHRRKSANPRSRRALQGPGARRSRPAVSSAPRPEAVLGLVDGLDPLLLLQAGQSVLAEAGRLQLALELAPALQALGRKLAARDGLFDSAAGLAAVAAVAEAAARGQLLDVGEGGAETLLSLPELELAHAGGVQDQPAAGQQEELPVGRGVASAVVALPHRADPLGVTAEEAVDQRRLAHPRRAEDADRL